MHREVVLSLIAVFHALEQFSRITCGSFSRQHMHSAAIQYRVAHIALVLPTPRMNHTCLGRICSDASEVHEFFMVRSTSRAQRSCPKYTLLMLRA